MQAFTLKEDLRFVITSSSARMTALSFKQVQTVLGFQLLFFYFYVFRSRGITASYCILVYWLSPSRPSLWTQSRNLHVLSWA